MEIAKWAALVIILGGSGCATSENDACPSLAREPVSGCRARVKCQLRSKTTYAVGFRSPAAMLPGNHGIDMGPSPVTDNFSACISRDLQEQEAMKVINKKGNL